MSGSDILLGIGMVLVIEGLVYVLAPHLVERLLEALRQIPLDQRRLLGALTLVTGLIVLWLAKGGLF
ncbi:DUF2065 domain-containing protein [Mameliella sediminis]|uniref:DUF2065 domain-containing protein n=1 Tax=Mameliella sediminis TaxID=2836866 RepID=UPI001C45B58E|nr:DUF2065 domain-containing protein [Mameliella sediminis]MBY6116262.1 DUF2065 domain-containing protein [Antarctobacter heliothermus]MBY6146227.1 DUF2065 domain-containing protein [Mameliella alba]MBV7397015.1 DUF2065 domain-containing protein [Mameliella sediminis]MBY6161884.1 DUF2065 domain-containing protein [Mameliella alba]MBY6170354.1 DUF2065 domain-containing protein [Mameliella alba]